ncbi:MAG: signal peptidase I [Patescibacteria group bacterium]|jgi:signal peptidase I
MTFLDKINQPRTGTPEEAKSDKQMESKGGLSFFASMGGFALEIVKVVVISLAIIIPVRYFLIQPFYVKGASMEPSFYDNQYLMIDEISYRFAEPHRGDIIVFKYPENPSQFFIKRVIGVPGETVEIRNGHVIIYNTQAPRGEVLDESPYLAADVYTSGNETVELKSNEFYVMGDNREQSLDSRRIGPITKNYIVGRTWIRAWPLNKWQVFHDPAYNL